MRTDALVLLAACALCLSSYGSAAPAPQRILETLAQPSQVDTGDHGWAGNVCGNGTSFSVGGARHEWTPVIPGFGQYGSTEPVSGWAFAAHDSKGDVPFVHPFGKFDFDYMLLPDTRFASLIAPGNVENIQDDAERVEAQAQAQAAGLPLDPGFMAVEQDRGLVPAGFRPNEGDRVALFGRWIVDCGHANWQTEIHPPLLAVVARPDPASPTTHVTVASQPFLVDQEFPRGSLLNQLGEELALVNTPLPFVPFNDQVKAESKLLPPSGRLEVMSFLIRPPVAAPSPQHRLFVRMNLTARPGVVVAPFQADAETLGVIVLFTDGLTQASPPDKHTWNVSGEELKALDKNIGLLYEDLVAHLFFNLGDPVKGAVLARGIRAVLYDDPAVPDLAAHTPLAGWAAKAPWGMNPLSVDANQAFPLLGSIDVGWDVPPVSIAATVASNRAAAIWRNVDIARYRGPKSTSAAPERIAAMTQALAAARGAEKETLSGLWHYRIRTPGAPVQGGDLTLRVNGTQVQGAIVGSDKRAELLSGTWTPTPSSESLMLIGVEQGARFKELRLVRRGSTFAGPLPGTSATFEMTR